MQLKALLINDDLERSELLKQSLLEFGHDVVGEARISDDLLKRVEATQADLLVIHSDSPGKVLLSRLHDLAACKPLPVVLFTAEDNPEVIHRAVRTGVSAYVIDGLERHRLGPIVDVAVARFHETDRLRRELQNTRTNLLERKTVERAKGILMKQRGFDEPQAYHALRKMAMDKNLRIGQVAENVITVAELLN